MDENEFAPRVFFIFFPFFFSSFLPSYSFLLSMFDSFLAFKFTHSHSVSFQIAIHYRWHTQELSRCNLMRGHISVHTRSKFYAQSNSCDILAEAKFRLGKTSLHRTLTVQTRGIVAALCPCSDLKSVCAVLYFS